VGIDPGGCPLVVVMNCSVRSVNPQLYERMAVCDVGASPVVTGEEDHAKERQAPQET
jgi:hypothetical protein